MISERRGLLSGVRGVITLAIEIHLPFFHDRFQLIQEIVAPTCQVSGIHHAPGLVRSGVVGRLTVGEVVKNLQTMDASFEAMLHKIVAHGGVVHYQKVCLGKSAVFLLRRQLVSAEGS